MSNGLPRGGFRSLPPPSHGSRRVGSMLAPECSIGLMPRYHFKLVDSRRVSDFGLHELIDDTIAQIRGDKAGAITARRSA